MEFISIGCSETLLHGISVCCFFCVSCLLIVCPSRCRFTLMMDLILLRVKVVKVAAIFYVTKVCYIYNYKYLITELINDLLELLSVNDRRSIFLLLDYDQKSAFFRSGFIRVWTRDVLLLLSIWHYNI
jgi:hypothetical protein